MTLTKITSLPIKGSRARLLSLALTYWTVILLPSAQEYSMLDRLSSGPRCKGSATVTSAAAGPAKALTPSRVAPQALAHRARHSDALPATDACCGPVKLCLSFSLKRVNDENLSILKSCR